MRLYLNILVIGSCLQWNDSIDGLEGGTSDHAIRCHLPSPKGTKVSPLTKYKPTKITRSRKTKRWSQLEEETRKTAVDKYVLVIKLVKNYDIYI